MSETVLLVEDDLAFRETLKYRLTQEGYQVREASDGFQAVEVARKEQPDVILLDVILPGIDGFEVCRLLRREMTTPILMLTARTDEVDRIVGLEVGADDYITKPFSMRELLARIKVQLRRVRMCAMAPSAAAASKVRTVVRFGDLVVDPVRCEVQLQGKLLRLKPREFELLATLVQHPGQVLSRDYLMKAAWGWAHTGQSRTVDVHIRWLREKIEKDPGNPRWITTVRGVGYRFDVQDAGDA